MGLGSAVFLDGSALVDIYMVILGRVLLGIGLGFANHAALLVGDGSGEAPGHLQQRVPA